MPFVFTVEPRLRNDRAMPVRRGLTILCGVATASISLTGPEAVATATATALTAPTVSAATAATKIIAAAQIPTTRLQGSAGASPTRSPPSPTRSPPSPTRSPPSPTRSPPSPVGSGGPVRYQLPVPGGVVDTWRPPTRPFGAGNVGIDLAAAPGDPVVAPADGLVTFAGAVGPSLFVVILHADGVRTTIGFVRSVLVRSGAYVTRGTPVAVAAGPVHFGARRGTSYFDPRTLLLRRVWLVG